MIYRISLLIALSVTLHSQAKAQSNFFKIYDIGSYQEAITLFQNSNNEFFVGGLGELGHTAPVYITTIKLDKGANVLWVRRTGEQGSFNVVAQILSTPLGYSTLGFLPGIGTTVTIYDDAGNTVSNVVETDSLWRGVFMNVNSQNGLTIVAEQEEKTNDRLNDILITKTDLKGEPVSAQLYGNPLENETPTKFFEQDDGGLIVCGNTTEGTLDPYYYYQQIFVFRTNSSGEVVWKTIVNSVSQNQALGFIKCKDGNYMVMSFKGAAKGLLALTKIDSNGNILWSKDIDAPQQGFCQAFVETSEGNFIIVGEYGPDNADPDLRYSVIWGVSASGDLQWQRLFTFNEVFNSAQSIIATNDGNFVVGGKILSGNDLDFFLMKIGNDGCMMNSLTLGGDTTTCLPMIKLNAGSGYTSYQWTTGSVDSTIVATTSGTYGVTVENNENCFRSDSIKITIKDCVVYDSCSGQYLTKDDLFIPDVITPGNDDNNEYFIVPDLLIGSRLSIINRWGLQVYQSNNYKNDWNGGQLSSGVYYYSLKSNCINMPFKGTLSIIK